MADQEQLDNLEAFFFVHCFFAGKITKLTRRIVQKWETLARIRSKRITAQLCGRRGEPVGPVQALRGSIGSFAPSSPPIHPLPVCSCVLLTGTRRHHERRLLHSTMHWHERLDIDGLNQQPMRPSPRIGAGQVTSSSAHRPHETVGQSGQSGQRSRRGPLGCSRKLLQLSFAAWASAGAGSMATASGL